MLGSEPPPLLQKGDSPIPSDPCRELNVGFGVPAHIPITRHKKPSPGLAALITRLPPHHAQLDGNCLHWGHLAVSQLAPLRKFNSSTKSLLLLLQHSLIQEEAARE